ncbi:MAG: endonuclease/exonuclease/phosphatase [Leptolyngbyaceae cyanobacterium SU_3_3]|nr:endonuclease/exonuclease/phosphatase [Leptolyngbyaceae cyanobacterium SU_3_3]NJR51727.1 endonuclease/exonuclease/phosphatase [Leptolyngbyaceae cyanobacterium CSU_1_3]
MTELSTNEWDKINQLLATEPYKYGLPKREYGSVVLASFNIRKLGARKQRSEATWKFLAQVCQHFDLLAVQEIMDDLEGFDRLKELMGLEYGAVVSDVTGAFPGEQGLGERLGFIYNRSLIERGNIVSDVSYDRTKLLTTLIEHKEELKDAIAPHLDPKTGEIRKGAKIQLPVFLTFVRQPFCASFRIAGHPGTQPYEFMAVNAHLYFGEGIEDRRQEFDALMEWIMGRVKEEKGAFSSFILLGDLNLDFDDPEQDRPRIEAHIKTFNQAMGKTANVNFPFIDIHPKQQQQFRTNARSSETFDQIALFSRDPRFPTYKENAMTGSQLRGPDYGVFNFVELFREALGVQPLEKLSASEKRSFFAKFEHEVSDHLPLWLRLPLPEDEVASSQSQ